MDGASLLYQREWTCHFTIHTHGNITVINGSAETKTIHQNYINTHALKLCTRPQKTNLWSNTCISNVKIRKWPMSCGLFTILGLENLWVSVKQRPVVHIWLLVTITDSCGQQCVMCEIKQKGIFNTLNITILGYNIHSISGLGTPISVQMDILFYIEKHIVKAFTVCINGYQGVALMGTIILANRLCKMVKCVTCIKSQNQSSSEHTESCERWIQ